MFISCCHTSSESSPLFTKGGNGAGVTCTICDGAAGGPKTKKGKVDIKIHNRILNKVLSETVYTLLTMF